jgi:hypothetical protein
MLWARWSHLAGTVPLWAVLALQAGLVTLRLHGPAEAQWPATGLPVVDAWGHLDSVWYVNIAQDGYAYSSRGASAWAFFPAYPVLMYAVTAATGVAPAVAGYVLALVFGLAALIVFTEFASLWLPRKRAALAAAGFALYPYSFFLRGPLYTDGMALVFMMGALLALERRRIALSCLLALLATCTRFEVIPLAVALSWRAWELRPSGGGRRWAVALLPGGSALLGQGLVSANSLYRVGDPIAFFHAQSYVGWQGSSVAARLIKRGYLHRLAALVIDHQIRVGLVLETAGLLSVVAACCLVPVVARQLSRAYASFVVLTVAVIAFGTSNFFSSGRFMLACFPCFVALAGLRLRKGPWVALALTVALVTQAVLAFGFSQSVLVG